MQKSLIFTRIDTPTQMIWNSREGELIKMNLSTVVIIKMFSHARSTFTFKYSFEGELKSGHQQVII